MGGRVIDENYSSDCFALVDKPFSNDEQRRIDKISKIEEVEIDEWQ